MKRQVDAHEQPPHTTARQGFWAIWVQVAPTGPRLRLKTWIPVKRDKRGKLQGGPQAAAVLSRLAVLWEGGTRRWDVLEALRAKQFTLDELDARLQQRGVEGAAALFEETRAPATAPGADIDLVPLVQQWMASPLNRQNGKGMISVPRRLQEVARVLKLISPALLAWNNACALAARPTTRNQPPKPRPAQPVLPVFPLAALTAERIQAHLGAHYSMEPSPEQRDKLESAQPNVSVLTRSLLTGQGDGARAAFDGFRVFARWLIAQGVLRDDPTATLNKPSESTMKIRKLGSQADVETLARRLPSPMDDIWRMLCGTGLEPSVGLHLDLTHMDAVRKEIIGLGTKNLTRQRRVETSDAVWGAIAPHLVSATESGRESLWPRVDAKGRKITRFLFAEEVRRASAELVAEGATQFRDIHPYSARHTFVVLALEAGVPAREVADQLGQRDETMVLKRYKLWLPKPGRIRAALNAQQGAHAASATPHGTNPP